MIFGHMKHNHSRLPTVAPQLTNCIRYLTLTAIRIARAIQSLNTESDCMGCFHQFIYQIQAISLKVQQILKTTQKNNRNLFCIVKIKTYINKNKNILYTPNILNILNLLNKFQQSIYNKAKRFNKTFTSATVNRLII